MTRSVAALFVRSDSCYFDLAHVDCWDVTRDARSYTEPGPVVAHPPCRGWGRLSHLAKPRADELALALFAVDTVRRVGGVLEHPHGSKLWAARQLPRPGALPDDFGGWTLLVDQGWWGHPAPKPTWLYIVGCSRDDVGDLPVQLRRAAGRTMALSPADRERTPPLFAEFLVGIARKCAGSELQRAARPVTSSQDRGSYVDLVAAAAAKRAAFMEWASRS